MIFLFIAFMIFIPSILYLIFKFKGYVNLMKFLYKFIRHKAAFVFTEKWLLSEEVNYIVIINNSILRVSRREEPIYNKYQSIEIIDNRIKIIDNYNVKGSEYKLCVVKAVLVVILGYKLNNIKAPPIAVDHTVNKQHKFIHEVKKYNKRISRKEKLNKLLK